MTQSQKDFLALSHGQEWVTFYESFDKLVQDNLSRSSELLRRAMALPEVADREVQQIRSEMEEKLANEKARQRAMLSSLQEDLSGSYRQVSMLARSVGSVIGDLERLSQRVDEAIVAFDAEASVAPEVAEVVAPVSNGVAQSNGVASAYSAPAAPADPVVPEPVVAAPEPVADLPEMPEFPVAEADVVNAEAVEDAPATFSVDDIAAAVEEQNAMLEAAEHKLDDLEAAIDLSALAEAEVVTPDVGSEPVAVEAAAVGVDAQSAESGEQRPRPHWLSVTRGSSR
jgi:hypothetical protein